MKRIVLILFSFALIASCKTKKDVMNEWLGHSRQELVAKYGEPARAESDGRTGTIMVYADKVSGQKAPTYDYKIFYLNKEGKVYSTLTKTVNIPPERINMSSFKRY